MAEIDGKLLDRPETKVDNLQLQQHNVEHRLDSAGLAEGGPGYDPTS